MSKDFRSFIFWAAIVLPFIFAYRFEKRYEEFYLGQNLVEKNLILSKAPKFKGAKSGSRYILSSENYDTKFRIEWYIALRIGEKAFIENQIDSLKYLDVVKVKFRESDIKYLYSKKKEISIVRLEKGEDIIFTEQQVRKIDEEYYKSEINFFKIAMILIYSTLVFYLYKMYKQRC